MPDVSLAAALPLLREEELRQGLEPMHLAARDLDHAVDALLAGQGLGRAHHRIIHFAGRQPQPPASDLLGLLEIPKQSLSRLVADLVKRGLVAQRAGLRDRRQRPGAR